MLLDVDRDFVLCLPLEKLELTASLKAKVFPKFALAKSSVMTV